MIGRWYIAVSMDFLESGYQNFGTNYQNLGRLPSEVMMKMVGKLENNALVINNEGPWAAQTMLMGRPSQVDVPWHEYQWCLCVSYW